MKSMYQESVKHAATEGTPHSVDEVFTFFPLLSAGVNMASTSVEV